MSEPRPPLRRLVPIQPRPPTASSSQQEQRVAVTALHTQTPAVSAAKDAQRSRHRLAVKRAYHAKLTGLNALRAEELALSKQYEQLLQQQSSPVDEEPASDSKALYVRLLNVRRTLERENTALREIACLHEQFQTRARLAALAEGLVAIDDGGDEERGGRAGSTGFLLSAVVKQPPASPVVKIKPLTMAACLEVIHETWPQVVAFMRCQNRLQLGSEVFGWSHKYRFPPSAESLDMVPSTSGPSSVPSHKLQYSISKVFPSMTAYELSQRGWEIMTTQRHYQALHSSTMTSQMHLVQRIDNDNMVFLRILQRGGQSILFKTLLLASQFQVDKGVLTIYRGLDPSLVVDDGASTNKHLTSSNVVWLDMFSWTYFEDQDDGTSVRFEFGGEMRHTSNDNARFWMMEVLLMALRWENMAVGPLFKLTNT